MRPRDARACAEGDIRLEALATALSDSVETMPPDARDAVRTRLLAEIAPPAEILRVRLARAIVAVAAGMTLMGGASYAAAVSAPGDALYPAKRAALSVAAAVGRSLGVAIGRGSSEGPGPARGAADGADGEGAEGAAQPSGAGSPSAGKRSGSSGPSRRGKAAPGRSGGPHGAHGVSTDPVAPDAEGSPGSGQKRGAKDKTSERGRSDANGVSAENRSNK